jgi:hypothetical protein
MSLSGELTRAIRAESTCWLVLLTIVSGCGFDTAPLTKSASPANHADPRADAGIGTKMDTLAAMSGSSGAGGDALDSPSTTSAGTSAAMGGMPASSTAAGSGGVDQAGAGASSAGMDAAGNQGSGGRGDAGSAGTASGAGAAGDAGSAGSAGTAGSGSAGPHDCRALPPLNDYGAPGPFSDSKMFSSVGPSGEYTLFRPGASLGRDGFLHPIVVWGGGYTTTPEEYQATLTLLASHGFVIVACNDAQATSDCLSSGLDWLIAQNSVPGALRGKLDVSRGLALGHSSGVGGVLTIARRMNIKAVVSLQGIVVSPESSTGGGMPNMNLWAMQHAPLLLIAASGDALATPASVQSNFQSSQVQTFFSTLNDDSAGQMYALDKTAAHCGGSTSSMFGTCETAALEHAPVIAWFRLWACDDPGARRYFYGDDCALCTGHWTNPLRKHWK